MSKLPQVIGRVPFLVTVDLTAADFFKECVLVLPGCHNKMGQIGWPKERNFIFSQFWRLGV